MQIHRDYRKLNLKPLGSCTPVRTAHLCIQHRTVLIILPPIIQTITTAQMSIGMDKET